MGTYNVLWIPNHYNLDTHYTEYIRGIYVGQKNSYGFGIEPA